MHVPIYQVDAFAARRFAGNPAAVVVLPDFLEDGLLQAIAQENNLAETAFLVAQGHDYRLRWFTPTVEVPFCGHATLASAATVLRHLAQGRDTVAFHTASGRLTVTKTGDTYRMDFPARVIEPIDAPPSLQAALGATPREVVWDGFNFLAQLDTSDTVRRLTPDLTAIARLDAAGVIVTARDATYDFVSRYFAPAKGISEDPVTGGAHCALTPYWAQRLGKTAFHAYQASARGGEMRCRLAGDRVELEGTCVFYLEGTIEV